MTATIRTLESHQTWGDVTGDQVRALANILARRIDNGSIQVRVDHHRWGATAETWKIHVFETIKEDA